MDSAPADPTVRTTCPYCGVGCGVLATPRANGTVAISGDPAHPANFGRLCSKGSALGETLGPDRRLLHPSIAGQAASWDLALGTIASTFAATIEAHGPDSVALYVSGQLLTEDYYVANKLMKGFIGSANIDTNSRLCMSSSVAGHRRAFGADTVPGCYADLEQAELLVLVGSNLAWCHPVLFQRVMAAKAARPGMRIVVVDPRRTTTADAADLHLAIRPDGDTALFTALLAHLFEAGAIDRSYVDDHTTGLAEALDAARQTGDVAAATGLAAADIAMLFDLFAHTEKVVTVYSQGVNQSASGTDKVNAIINCHLATGRIGRPGMGPFSVTGQPNAMGGREVGGLANQLAAHMDLDKPAHRDRVQRFWKAPRIAATPGLQAVAMFDAVADGRIKALWIIGTNPVDSLPDADRVRAGLATCPFVVVSDIVSDTDTLPYAHVVLPAAGWGEKDGTVTNSERRISRQRAFLQAPGEAWPDWRILAEVARRMGFGAAFDWESPDDVFDEHARLSATENEGDRDFDLAGLVGMSAEEYQVFPPVQWPVPRLTEDAAPADAPQPDSRFFAAGGFFTPDRRARFVPVLAASPLPEDACRPFTLNTGRIRDQWHTMTRTGRAPRLSAHIAEPFAEIHPDDARDLGVGDADIVRLETGFGSGLFRACLTPRQRRGSLFAPMHWTEQFASASRAGALTQKQTDPHSGQPALKSTPVSLARFPVAWHGFAVTRLRPSTIPADYWAVARTEAGWRIELAGLATPQNWPAFAADLFGADAADLLSYHDATTARFAAFDGETLQGALWTAPGPVAVSRAWAAGQLLAPHALSRQRILAGRGGADTVDVGAIVCACFSVGAGQISGAVRSGRCRSVAEIGGLLQAGTNCGSCRTEIQEIIDGCLVLDDA
ncbi:nitrate reductase [Aureimonas sp. SA4125]|uniref:nitrate reductase n=1 Tax=Aureimonas sp. SA4125 TaxID=2826993 RepID=UPI001CC515AC|nr:nitrate reductase [Aureimonas sp. SA4125]BDA84590.1 nitrate reductase [Aureimonas sp. SA4125]